MMGGEETKEQKKERLKKKILQLLDIPADLKDNQFASLLSRMLPSEYDAEVNLRRYMKENDDITVPYLNKKMTYDEAEKLDTEELNVYKLAEKPYAEQKSKLISNSPWYVKALDKVTPDSWGQDVRDDFYGAFLHNLVEYNNFAPPGILPSNDAEYFQENIKALTKGELHKKLVDLIGDENLAIALKKLQEYLYRAGKDKKLPVYQKLAESTSHRDPRIPAYSPADTTERRKNEVLQKSSWLYNYLKGQ